MANGINYFLIKLVGEEVKAIDNLSFIGYHVYTRVGVVRLSA